MLDNNEAHIARLINANKVFYFISVMNNAKTAQLNIILECDRADEETAKTIIDEMLSSVRFKE